MPTCLQQRLLIVCLVLFPCVRSWAAEPTYEPTSSYSTQTMEGWPIRVSHAFMSDQQELRDSTLKVLQVKLFEITRVVPPAALVKLREVSIWVELKDRDIPCMVYHPSKGWLNENGYNPDKEKGVEIANAGTFLKWTHEQPWMVLHELAHSYHDRVLNFDNEEIEAVYKAAVESHKYEHVLYIHGGKVRHYALTNAKEYFAESSEAFFGTNDFYPFVRPELAEFDPAMFHLLEKMWGMKDQTKN